MDGVRNLIQLVTVSGALSIVVPAAGMTCADARVWLFPAAGPDGGAAAAPTTSEANNDAGPANAPPGTLSANGPVRLDGGRSAWAPLEQSRPTPEDAADQGSPDPDLPDVRVEPSDDVATMAPSARDVAAVDSAPSSAANESKPLGRDSGPLRLGATGESKDSAATTGSDGFLSEGLGEALRVGGALAVVVGLLLLFAMLTRRLSGTLRAGRPAGVLEVLARYPVGRGQHLTLLKLDRRVLLVHQTTSSMTTLADLREPGEVASLLSRIEAAGRETTGGRFQSLLNRAGSRFADDRVTGTGAVVAREGDVETIDLTRGSFARRRLLP